MKKKCKYSFKTNFREFIECEMPIWEKSDNNYCIFHEPDPDKPQKIFNELLKKQLKNGGANPKNYFHGYYFNHSYNFNDLIFNNNVYFNQVKFAKNITFENIVFNNKCFFTGMKILNGKKIIFENINFRNKTYFNENIQSGLTVFNKNHFTEKISFENSTFNHFIFKNNIFEKKATADFVKINFRSICNISNCKCKNEMRFYHSIFKGNTYISDNLFENKIFFQGTNFYKKIFCKNNIFRYPEDKEIIYRKARNIWEKSGYREHADHYFIMERRAKREQIGFTFNNCKEYYRYLKKTKKFIKKINPITGKIQINNLTKLLWRFFEWILADLTTGYGTRWLRIIFWWIFFIGGFGYIYSNFNLIKYNSDRTITSISFLEGLYFSVVTFFSLGYGDYIPKQGPGQIFVGIQAMLGAFFVAAFIAVFARKFMR